MYLLFPCLSEEDAREATHAVTENTDLPGSLPFALAMSAQYIILAEDVDGL